MLGVFVWALLFPWDVADPLQHHGQALCEQPRLPDDAAQRHQHPLLPRPDQRQRALLLPGLPWHLHPHSPAPATCRPLQDPAHRRLHLHHGLHLPGVPHRLWLLLHLLQHHRSGEYLVFLIIFGCYSIYYKVVQVSTWCSSSSLAVAPSASATALFRWVPGVPHRLWLLLHLLQHRSGEYLVFLIVFGCYSICYNIVQVSTWCSSSSLAVTASATTSFRWVPGVPHRLWLLLHLLQHHHSGECCRHLVWAARFALSFCVAVWGGGGGNSISNTIIVQVTIFSKYSITQIRWGLQLPISLVGIPFATDRSGCCGTRQADGPKFTPPGSEMPPG